MISHYNKNNGQASLEYLLIIAVFVCAACIMLPAITNLNNAAAHAIELKKAQGFSDVLRSKILFMHELAEDSCLEVEARPVSEWKLLPEKNGFVLSVAEKEFDRVIPENSFIEETVLERDSVLAVRKIRGGVSVVNSNC